MKKVLVISYDFPPVGLGSVQRVVKFVKYFPRFDWEPVVLTCVPKKAYAKDNSLLEEVISGGAKIYRTPLRSKKNLLHENKVIPLPGSKKKALNKLLTPLNLKNEASAWKSKALKTAEQIFRENKIELIFATAPPFIDFTIALELKEKFKVPIVCDYRSSWAYNPMKNGPQGMGSFANSRLEGEILRKADKLLTVNRRIKELIIEHYPTITHNDVTIVPHCFDREDFPSATGGDYNANKYVIKLCNAGTYSGIYDPSNFLKAAELAIEKNSVLKDRIEIQLAGIYSKEELASFRSYKVNIKTPGYFEHRSYINFLKDSTILWLVINNEKGAEIISTVKLYEYIGSGKPIIACVPDGVAKASLKHYNAVKICSPDDIPSMTAAILEYCEDFDKGILPVGDPAFANAYDIEKITQQLVRQFEFLIDVNPEFTRKNSIGITTKLPA